MWEDGEDSVDEPDAWHSCKEDKPKVEEHVDLEMVSIKKIHFSCFSYDGAPRVDLLVDDVQRQDTEGVVLLKGAWRTKLLERTLRHLHKTGEEAKGDKASLSNLWKDSV